METTYKISFTKIRSVVAKLLQKMSRHGGQNVVFSGNIIRSESSGVHRSCILVRYFAITYHETSFCVGFTQIASVVAEKSQKMCRRKGTFCPSSDGFCDMLKNPLWRCLPNVRPSKSTCHKTSFDAGGGPLAYREVGGAGQNMCAKSIERRFQARKKSIARRFRHFQQRYRVSSITRRSFTSRDHKKVACAQVILRKNAVKVKKSYNFDHI